MKKLLLPAIFFLFALVASGQVRYDFATEANRAKHDLRLIDTVILGALQGPLSSETEQGWRQAFWAMELMLYKTPFTESKVAQAWRKMAGLPEVFQKALLEVSYTLFPGTFQWEAGRLLQTTSAPAVFVRCAEYLLLGNNPEASRKLIKRELEQRFGAKDFLGFEILKQRLVAGSAQKRPPLDALFDRQFLPGETVIYSLQRSNRNYPGMVLIRDGNGHFVKNKTGEIFHASQLARSITNYPFYLTNGNTPQGLFRWTGFDTSAIAYIGPTPNLQLVMPYEASPVVFFADSTLTTPWTKYLYASLLPTAWNSHPALYESWWAGLMGRTEIIMHGTTINPAYYKGQTYFLQTPSLGCLCSYEEWDKNGRRIRSSQQQIVDALLCLKSSSGFVVVVDLDDQQKPVTIDEVRAFLK